MPLAMSTSLFAAVLGLLFISLADETHSLDLHHESSPLFDYGVKSRIRRFSDDFCASYINFAGSYRTTNEYPWMVALFINREGIINLCGGTLITDQFILTSATCVEHVTAEDVTASVGDHIHSSESETKSQNYQIEEIIIHEEYLNNTMKFNFTSFLNISLQEVRNDIALLKVNGNMELNEKVSTICLSKSEKEYNDEIATVTGWVKTVNNYFSIMLKENELLVVANSKCISLVSKKNDSNSFASFTYIDPSLCAADANFYRCRYLGSPGGPLLIKNKNDKWEQIGIKSVGNPIFPQPVFFTRVSEFVEWIESKTGKGFQSNC